jgi:hypothetical protein
MLPVLARSFGRLTLVLSAIGFAPRRLPWPSIRRLREYPRSPSPSCNRTYRPGACFCTSIRSSKRLAVASPVMWTVWVTGDPYVVPANGSTKSAIFHVA